MDQRTAKFKHIQGSGLTWNACNVEHRGSKIDVCTELLLTQALSTGRESSIWQHDRVKYQPSALQALNPSPSSPVDSSFRPRILLVTPLHMSNPWRVAGRDELGICEYQQCDSDRTNCFRSSTSCSLAGKSLLAKYRTFHTQVNVSKSAVLVPLM